MFMIYSMANNIEQMFTIYPMENNVETDVHDLFNGE